MKNINLWDSGFSKYYRWSNDIDEFIEMINSGTMPINFKIKDKFNLGDSITNILENKASESNLNLTYVDDEHCVAINTATLLSSYVYSSFYEKYRERINDAIKHNLLNNSDSIFEIRPEIFDEELLDFILNKDNISSLWLYNVNLTDEQIKKIKNKYIDAYIKDDYGIKQISSNILFKSYKINDLRTKDEFYLPINISDEQIEYLREIKDGSTLIIEDKNKNGFENYNEINKYKKINELISKINTTGKKFIIKINVDNRNIFNSSQSFINDENNQIIVVTNDHYDYSVQEYLAEEKQLDELVQKIKGANLSPFEKYIAVYNIVKNFKPYKENSEKWVESRNLRCILNNEYMVCVGYAKLLSVLLDRVGIQNTKHELSIYKVDEENNDVNSFGGHVRNIVSIDDDKYGIHGYYVADATWDNKIDKNYLNHALMTFDSATQSNEMFSGNTKDYFFNIHSYDEFVQNINSLYNLKKSKQSSNNNFFNIYNVISWDLINFFSRLDNNKYNELVEMFPGFLVHDSCMDILTNAGQYLAQKCNNSVEFEKVLEADICVQKELYGLSETDVFEYRTKLYNDNLNRNDCVFPYELIGKNNWELKSETQKRNK